jgi:hypothetical protein
MRSLRTSIVFFVLILVSPVWSQQSVTSQVQSAANKDPQAIAIINQTLIAAGGASTIGAITDYTATGNITYQFPLPNIQGTVTLRALGIGQFRMDAVLPSGTRSEVFTDSHQIRDEHGLSSSYTVPMSSSRVAFPVMPLIPALINPSLNLTYKGLVQLGGRSVHQIEVQRFLPIALHDPDSYFHNFHTVEYFIDASTLTIAAVQDVLFNKAVRQISYSNYQLTAGVMVPFSIAEQVEGQTIWGINLGQISFNSGLQDSDFQF